MAQLIIGSILRLIMKPPKKRPQSMRQANPGDVEAAGGAVAAPMDGLTPEEEAYAAKRKKMIRIACIVGVTVTLCWMLEIPLLPMLKNAAKWAEKSLKHADTSGGAEGDGTTGSPAGDTSADIFSSLGKALSSMRR